ncbi:MAG: thiamine phosphate synthase [Bacteroides sp.]|nr:thiamine phosphate synthase [Bacteroides sp.]
MAKRFELQFITHQTQRYDTLSGALLALRGGCRWIQLRMKDASAEEVEKTGRLLREECRKYGARLLLNDHVELVAVTGADGVHLGLSDMPVREARALLGKDYLIGGTANTFENVQQHYLDGADYVGIGPFRYTTTKKNLSPVLGVEGYTDILRRMRKSGIALPVVAIGGILCEDLPALRHTGIQGIAISGAILQATRPEEETARFIRCWKGK